MPTVRVNGKGQVTLPKAIREQLCVGAGDQIDFVLTERGEVIVRRLSPGIRELKGLLKRPGRRAISVEGMNAAILRRHATKP